MLLKILQQNELITMDAFMMRKTATGLNDRLEEFLIIGQGK